MASEKNESQEDSLAQQKANCVFCKILKKEIPSKIIYNDKICTAILDINPANEGHILLMPNEHYQVMPQIPDEQIAHMGIISKKLSKALLLSTYGKSTSIFMANGAAAGQKAPHFMIHIIPRKNPQEFFKIIDKETNEQDLEKLKIILIQKLNHLLGIKSDEKQVIPKKQEEKSQQPVQPIEQSRPNEIGLETKKHLVQEIEEELTGRKIKKLGIKKEPGYLYFVDEDGDISRVPMARGNKQKIKGKKEKVSKQENPDKNQINSKKEVTLDDISNMLLGGKI